jgi:steroid delta-isomerase-like uncharacterized protein
MTRIHSGHPSETLIAAREATIRAHMGAEERLDAEATLRTFFRPRYEVMPSSEEHEGPAAVAGFLGETFAAFPDLHFTTNRLYHSDDAVLVEARFHGTHGGPWRGLPATGRTVSYPMLNVFLFEEDRLVCERLYFDLQTILCQLGLAHDVATPAGRVATALGHPLTLAQAGLRMILGR